jgi:hypothetical protein
MKKSFELFGILTARSKRSAYQYQNKKPSDNPHSLNIPDIGFGE